MVRSVSLGFLDAALYLANAIQLIANLGAISRPKIPL
jgi:hypothetical protein